jgi:hypothetical protein
MIQHSINVSNLTATQVGEYVKTRLPLKALPTLHIKRGRRVCLRWGEDL